MNAYNVNIIDNAHECVFSNNIFTSTVAVPTDSNSTWNVYTYNLLVSSFTEPNPLTYNTTNLNIEGVPLTNIFVDQARYQLLETSPGKNAASDGTDMGLYGSASPAKLLRIPAYPAVTQFTVGGTSTAEGNLSVVIKVEAQE
jgi:hypothetical protein